MTLLLFLALVLAGFIGMELASYVVHRYLFHGPLWRVHETHHRTGHGRFELNDLFSVFFALVSVGLLVLDADDPLQSQAFPVGLGVAVYGVLYFLIHDLFTHRRFYTFKSRNGVLNTIRRAHQRHHQTATKHGFEPYGLFLFPYKRYRTPFRRTRSTRPPVSDLPS